MKVLMVLTSHAELGNTGEKTGFWMEEFAAPYYVLADAGATITIASPKGGQPPVDPKSKAAGAQTPATKRFDGDSVLQAKLANTVKLNEVKQADFDAVFLRDYARWLAPPEKAMMNYQRGYFCGTVTLRS